MGWSWSSLPQVLINPPGGRTHAGEKPPASPVWNHPFGLFSALSFKFIIYLRQHLWHGVVVYCHAFCLELPLQHFHWFALHCNYVSVMVLWVIIMSSASYYHFSCSSTMTFKLYFFIPEQIAQAAQLMLFQCARQSGQQTRNNLTLYIWLGMVLWFVMVSFLHPFSILFFSRLCLVLRFADKWFLGSSLW